jgi:hypothetical protein
MPPDDPLEPELLDAETHVPPSAQTSPGAHWLLFEQAKG